MSRSSSVPAPANPRITLRQVADAAGITTAAASMALRNNVRISKATRARVQAIAAKLGYRPDPKLSTLMQHLRTQSSVEYRETIAYLSMYPDYESWRHASHHDYYLGSCERAAELGYRVEVFHLAEHGMTPDRMSNLISARGIRGLLLGGFSKMGGSLHLKWDKFAAITSDYSLTEPVLHRASTDYYHAMISTLRLLEKEGHQRIGLNVSLNDDAKVLNRWRSAYSFYSDNIPPERRIPINICAPFNTPTTVGYGFNDWLLTHNPDAVVSAGCDFPQAFEASEGKQPPKNIRYVNMNISHADGRSRGIDQNPYAVGRLACGHLVTLLQRNELGIPDQPQVITIHGNWVENYNQWMRTRTHLTPPQIEWFQTQSSVQGGGSAKKPSRPPS